MSVEWRPDEGSVYLCSGNDNLALHRFKGLERAPVQQRLDHIGFIIDQIDQVDQWYEFLKAHQVRVNPPPGLTAMVPVVFTVWIPMTLSCR